MDKLLQDPYASEMVSIHAYLEILERLRISGAREGEAPGEAGEAVQLMSIHKSKGLEFPVVVLADFGRQNREFFTRWLPLSRQAIGLRADRLEYNPLQFRLAKLDHQCAEGAEAKRLLYVAATRAQEKLILNGHLSVSREKYTARGWLGDVFN